MYCQILKEFLNVHWLRPEVALLKTSEVIAMKDFVFESPSLDMGCGDGIFSFIRAGGGFNQEFDLYSGMKVDRNVFFDNLDIYDFKSSSTKDANPVKKPQYKISVALDHKNNLLEKSKRFDFYNDYVCHDANNALPFPSNAFASVFSNILYWLNNPQNVLHDVCRILSVGGRMALVLPDKSFTDYSFYQRLYLKTSDSRWKWLQKIDRGRSESIKHRYSATEWENMFNEAGLAVIQHKRFLSKFLFQIWDIGLRPVFPVLYKMQSKLNVSERLEVKKDWIDLLMEFALPIMENELFRDEDDYVWHYYELRK